MAKRSLLHESLPPIITSWKKNRTIFKAIKMIAPKMNIAPVCFLFHRWFPEGDCHSIDNQHGASLTLPSLPGGNSCFYAVYLLTRATLTSSFVSLSISLQSSFRLSFNLALLPPRSFSRSCSSSASACLSFVFRGQLWNSAPPHSLLPAVLPNAEEDADAAWSGCICISFVWRWSPLCVFLPEILCYSLIEVGRVAVWLYHWRVICCWH